MDEQWEYGTKGEHDDETNESDRGSQETTSKTWRLWFERKIIHVADVAERINRGGREQALAAERTPQKLVKRVRSPVGF